MNNRAGHCKRPPSQRRPPLPQLHQPSGRIPRVLTCQLSSHDSVDLNSDESSIKSTTALNFNKLSSPPNITGWRYSDEKQTIIASLNDPLSDIHLMSKEQIWRKYAHNYDQKKTVKNLAYLLKQHEEKEGPFSSSSNSTRNKASKCEASDEVEPWVTRNKKSRGWDLLYKLRLYPEKSGITGMTDKEIWESSELFKCYPLDDFTKYDKKMIKLTKKRREMVQQQHRDFEQDVANFPPSQRTNRGEPFWHRHAANTLLKEDVESGTANLMTPGELWRTKSEYMEFKQKTFAKHVFQEKSKQRAAPYWQVKCKKICQKLREEQAEELKHDWIQRMSQWKLSEDD